MGTITNISAARTKRDRLEVYHLAESVLPIFEDGFPGDFRPFLCLGGIKDACTGVASDEAIEFYRQQMQAVIDDAGMVASQSDSDEAWRLHPPIMAAYTIKLCLEPEIDLEAIHAKANEAFKYAERVKK